jgi:hypothetical protein
VEHGRKQVFLPSLLASFIINTTHTNSQKDKKSDPKTSGTILVYSCPNTSTYTAAQVILDAGSCLWLKSSL